MNSNELTPLSSRMRRISGTAKGLKRLQNRQKKPNIRRRKKRQQMFQSANKSERDFRRKVKQWERDTNQNRRGGMHKETNKPLIKLKKQIRRSQIARDKDQTIRNQMFHPNTSILETSTEGSSEKGQDNDCILIEEAIEMILIDDDEEKSRVLAEQNSQRPVENIVDSLTSKTSSDPPHDQTSTSDCVCVDTICKSEDIKTEMPNAVNKDTMEKSTLVFQQSIPKENQVEVISSGTESSDEETSENETSDSSEEDSSSSGSDRNEVKRKPLFFEDNTGNVHIPRSEVPLFDKSDIFNPTPSQSDDVVFVSSTPVEINRRKKRKKLEREDSVIFVSEEPVVPSIKNLDFIPLSTDDNKKLPPSKKTRNNERGMVTPPQKQAVGNADLFTASERKKNAIYNFNTYNPNREDNLPRGKRMVIIDGSNVAYGHACGHQFSVKGVQIAIEYFEKMGHEVKVVVPQYRLQKTSSSDPELLEKLHKEGKVVFTPCKRLPGKSSSSYDDRFILQLAVEFDAAIVSNDNYRDLLHENPAFKKIIESRVIGYIWCNDLFMLPKDPYGRNGPSLSAILNRV